MQFDLFGMPDNANQTGTITTIPEPEPERDSPMINAQEDQGHTGKRKPFIVRRCARCRQLILVDPAKYKTGSIFDRVCEACNPSTANKYLNFIKVRL